MADGPDLTPDTTGTHADGPAVEDALWRATTPGGLAVVATGPVGGPALALVDDLEVLAPNVSAAELADPGEGWHVDDVARVVGVGPAGPPPTDGLHARAAAALVGYSMADPGIVRGVWPAGRPLEGRRMVLEGRFGPLRFPMPVVVDSVFSGRHLLDGTAVHVDGWSYTTLEGHLERGRMDWSVWTWQDDGRVEVRIHATSTVGRPDARIVRLGLAVFGRAVQRTFTLRAAHLLTRHAGGTGRPWREARSAAHPGPLDEVLGPS